MSDRRSDQELVTRVQGGDRRAFDLLVIKYQQKVASLISRYVRDPGEIMDVAQEAFLKAYRALPGFRGESALARVPSTPSCIASRSIRRRTIWSLVGAAPRRRCGACGSWLHRSTIC